MDLAEATPLVTCDAREPTSSRNALIALIRHVLKPEASR
jgi:hypothetical protein